MAVKNILEEIERDVIDVTNTNFVHHDTRVVPSATDSELTYESGKVKKGKKIETCVLYVDIRNSVALTEKHNTYTMGRIYTAFTKAVLKVARHHNGHTRNIIGDRVMIVFPSKDCYTNSIECAISINHISHIIIKKHFTGVDFKCGIGIDFGELRVIKVGIQRYGSENGENKGLVWVGNPANIASRLTDIANKNIEETYFEFIRYSKKQNGFRYIYGFDSIEISELTPAELADMIYTSSNVGFDITEGKNIKLEKKVRINNFKSILMTEKVYEGFKIANPDKKSTTDLFEAEQINKIKEYEGQIYGGDVIWNTYN
jgi:adenylate cyclase